MMNPVIEGKAYILGDSVDTDQIIPAAHLVYSLSEPEERRMYGKYALSGVPEAQAGLPGGGIPFTQPDTYTSDFSIVIAGSNFGCGSSREHAPFALAEAGVKAVVADGYARIFYRNAVDGGFLVPFETLTRLVDVVKTGDEITIDTTTGTLHVARTDETYLLRPLGEVAGIVAAGGIFAFARQTGMIKAV